MQYLHSMDVPHGNIRTVRSLFYLFSHTLISSQTNVLVDADEHVHIGGLGVALLPSYTPGVDNDRFFLGAAPELADPGRFGLTDTGATKSSDVYAFGVLAWEVSIEVVARAQYPQNGTFPHQVFSEQVPFSSKSEVAAAVLMWKGQRPAKPDNLEISDPVWGVIRECWKPDPARRTSIAEVVAILEEEVSSQRSR